MKELFSRDQTIFVWSNLEHIALCRKLCFSVTLLEVCSHSNFSLLKYASISIQVLFYTAKLFSLRIFVEHCPLIKPNALP